MGKTDAHRVLVIANKWWEAEPLVGVLRHSKASPPGLKASLGAISATEPRMRIAFDRTAIEVWCVSDLLGSDANSSSTEKKAKVLGTAFEAGPKPALVLAFGTAGLPGEHSYNGSVVIGSEVFVYKAYPRHGVANPDSNWDDPRTGQLVPSPIRKDGRFAKLLRSFTDQRDRVESRFLTCPLNPAAPPTLMASFNYLSLGVANVTNYDDYAWSDHAALNAVGPQDAPIRSVETTHGLIRLQSEAPFLFLSGIADRVGYFDMEVVPRDYSQNFVASHNAAVATAWLLPEIAKCL